MAKADFYQRVVLLVLDGVGVGALPDATAYGDESASTLSHVAAATNLELPSLSRLGLGQIVPVLGSDHEALNGYWGKMAEVSPGKDSVTGHWELSGVIQKTPFATFPDGFPKEIISSFVEVTGLDPLGNIAASGTDILRSLGEEHLRTGRPIVYTSSDSVFQIAAHEDVIPPEELYKICRQTEQLLLPYNVCRVIARPFIGSSVETFKRTAGRHDFPRKPEQQTLLEKMLSAGLNTCGVGKIKDLFAGQGLSHSYSTVSNDDGMAKTLEVLNLIKTGLVMTNLVDFDMMYGHRLDVEGFASALKEFDQWLPNLMEQLTAADLLIISADHGCDPTTEGTDHTREYVPLLVWSPGLEYFDSLGSRKSFADVGATIAENFSLQTEAGESFLRDLK